MDNQLNNKEIQYLQNSFKCTNYFTDTWAIQKKIGTAGEMRDTDDCST